MWGHVVARNPEHRIAAAHRAAAAIVLLALAGGCGAQPAAAPPLVVCVSADNPPLSSLVKGQPRGLDLRIAQAAAAQLSRTLKVVPFETEYEKESSLAHEVNALLSSGVCDAASGFPLLTGDLGPPSRATARTPDYPGAKRKRERPFVPLGTLVGSRAYYAAALGIVLREPGQGIASLADLGDRRLGAVSGTLASAVAMTWHAGALRPHLVSLGQHEDALSLLAAPAPPFDAAMVPLAMFDGWKLAHPGAPLVAAAWRRPIGVNLGFVTLASASEVRAALDSVIARSLAEGQLARWASEEGVTWVAPIAPEVGPGPGLGDLARLAGD
jgi:ABC-type amino acid transport substrate-binding protein